MTNGTIKVLTESDLLHDHGMIAQPGYYVAEVLPPAPIAEGRGGTHRPAPVIHDGPYPSRSFATHVAETRFEMEAK